MVDSHSSDKPKVDFHSIRFSFAVVRFFFSIKNYVFSFAFLYVHTHFYMFNRSVVEWIERLLLKR